jgi:molecular chaperone GrpE
MTEEIKEKEVETQDQTTSEAAATEEIIETTPTLSTEELQTQLATAQAEAAKNLDGWQRSAADLANYKRRQEEQAQRNRENIIADIIREILPALDDLDLAFQNLPNSLNEQEVNWVDGFKLVQRKLIRILETHHIQPINTEGEFDPNLHEAVTHEPSPDHQPNTIIAEVRKGYKIGDRVLRPALVRVAQ